MIRDPRARETLMSLSAAGLGSRVPPAIYIFRKMSLSFSAYSVTTMPEWESSASEPYNIQFR